jgi:hypothetical protein
MIMSINAYISNKICKVPAGQLKEVLEGHSIAEKNLPTNIMFGLQSSSKLLIIHGSVMHDSLGARYKSFV